MDRGAWRTTVHGVAELDMMSDWHFHFLMKQFRLLSLLENGVDLSNSGTKWRP